jgi:hypothetical protein
MSRSKNAVKQSAVADLPSDEQYDAAQWGEGRNNKAFAAAAALQMMVGHKVTGNPELAAQIYAKNRDAFLSYIEREYLAAGTVPERGHVFRRLADAVETIGGYVKPEHCYFLNVLDWYRERKKVPTVSEMRLSFPMGKRPIRKTVERMFDYYKVEPRKDKRGPKPGTKQKKSVHRALRS